MYIYICICIYIFNSIVAVDGLLYWINGPRPGPPLKLTSRARTDCSSVVEAFFLNAPKGAKGEKHGKICEKSKVLLFFLAFLREFLCVHSLCEYDRNENNEQVVVVSFFFAFSQFFVFVSIFQIQSMVGNSKVFFAKLFCYRSFVWFFSLCSF